MSDRSLSEKARNRRAEATPSNRRALRIGPNAYECPFCGRFWRVYPTKVGTSCSGFVAAASDMHVALCEVATPEERRAIARIDEKRWKRNPPTHTVVNKHEHSGFKDGGDAS